MAGNTFNKIWVYIFPSADFQALAARKPFSLYTVPDRRPDEGPYGGPQSVIQSWDCRANILSSNTLGFLPGWLLLPGKYVVAIRHSIEL